MRSLIVLLLSLFFACGFGWIGMRTGGLRSQIDVYESFLWCVLMPVCIAASLYVLFY